VNPFVFFYFFFIKFAERTSANLIKAISCLVLPMSGVNSIETENQDLAAQAAGEKNSDDNDV